VRDLCEDFGDCKGDRRLPGATRCVDEPVAPFLATPGRFLS